MARGKSHIVNLRDIPSAYYMPTTEWIRFQITDQPVYLVDRGTVLPRPGSPLSAINRTLFAVFVSPLIQNVHVIINQIFYVG